MTPIETGLHYPLNLDALPKDWRIGYVGDFAEEIQPGFASGKYNKEGSGIPHLRPYNIDRQGKIDLSQIKSVSPAADRKRLKIDDVLFNNTNSPVLVGKTAFISSAGDWGFSNHMTRIRFQTDILPRFAAYQLHFLWMTGYYLHNCVKHVNQASISSKALAKSVPFVAPPLDQQKRIVAEIEKQFSRLDEGIDNLKRVQANLKRYKAAVLKAAVEGRLVETEAEIARKQSPSPRRGEGRGEGATYETGEQLLQRILQERRRRWEEAELAKMQAKGKTPKNDKWKQKYKEPAAPDTTDLPELPELPEGWVWARLDSIASVKGGITVDRKRIDPTARKVPYLRVANVQRGYLDLSEIISCLIIGKIDQQVLRANISHMRPKNIKTIVRQLISILRHPQ